MRAGQKEGRVVGQLRAQRRREAQRLRLLAAHHVVVAAHARDEMDPPVEAPGDDFPPVERER